jgi:hypothetical protein
LDYFRKNWIYWAPDTTKDTFGVQTLKSYEYFLKRAIVLVVFFTILRPNEVTNIREEGIEEIKIYELLASASSLSG